MSTNISEACTTYAVCVVAFAVKHIPDGVFDFIHNINWTTVGACVLLVARLLKDIPDAYDAVMSRYIKWKATRNDKSN